ncbi:hypothetical protein [Thalassococcus sp. S3]|uniref:hypothetical protein n=1 Tax=Thalassococcus sp. S3 TaxID=2017482 RepID=UPI001023FD42|nr:hypothetical protein [Thalassococcus sp. S3]QBF31281.1 hypothetical protein CFI11_08630 [Thalassococcus sp. S3]
MSAPDTNIEKQERRHAPSLLGIGAAVVFGLAMLVGLLIYVTSNGAAPTADAVTNTDQAKILNPVNTNDN